jgi:predicted NBD/HSP70 family sugar kinase
MVGSLITDTTEVSKNNKIKILNLIRNQGGITRPEIASLLGLSLPTVTRQVDSLLHYEKLIHEVGKGDILRGRPPRQLEFSGEDHYLIGINMGANRISGVLTNLNARVLQEDSIAPDINHDYERMIKSTAQLARNLIHKADVEEENVLGIGIAIGGLIEEPKHLLSYSATFNWKNKDIAASLNQYIQKPVLFDHTARVMALGELHYGIGSTIDNFVCILWGYGIGAASIIDGKPYFGSRGMAGEFGHIVVDFKSNIRCMCGNYGCLETISSGWGIEHIAKEKIASAPQSILHDMCKGRREKITAQMVAEAARQGDSLCLSIIHTAAEYMGLGLATFINLQNPQAIILGGGIMNQSDLVLEQAIEVAKEKSLQNIGEETLIQPVSLGKNCKTMGAVSLILDEVLNLKIPTNHHAEKAIPMVKNREKAQ